MHHYCDSNNPNMKIEEEIISKSRSIKILIQVSVESQSESDESKINEKVVDKINKYILEIIALVELSSSLRANVIKDFCGCCAVIKSLFPACDETLYKSLELARMRIEDKTESFNAPVILRLSEIEKLLLESHRAMKVSTRTANSTVVIQSPISEVEVRSTRLKRLFIVGDRLSTSINGGTQKSQYSQQSVDFGFFDEFDSSCEMHRSSA